MKFKKKQLFYEDQYQHGETHGPSWYQFLNKFTLTREDLAVNYVQANKLYGKSYLDLGCGEGELLRRIYPYFTNLIGVDIARNRLSIAKKKSQKYPKIQFKMADLDDSLPFSKNEFELITCLSSLEYVFDPASLISEISRVLKPNGVLILSVPNIAFLPERIKLLFGILPSWPKANGWQGGRLHNFTCASLSDLLQKHGLRVENKLAEGAFSQLRNFWPELLSGSCYLIARKKAND